MIFRLSQPDRPYVNLSCQVDFRRHRTQHASNTQGEPKESKTSVSYQFQILFYFMFSFPFLEKQGRPSDQAAAPVIFCKCPEGCLNRAEPGSSKPGEPPVCFYCSSQHPRGMSCNCECWGCDRPVFIKGFMRCSFLVRKASNFLLLQPGQPQPQVKQLKLEELAGIPFYHFLFREGLHLFTHPSELSALWGGGGGHPKAKSRTIFLNSFKANPHC